MHMQKMWKAHVHTCIMNMLVTALPGRSHARRFHKVGGMILAILLHVRYNNLRIQHCMWIEYALQSKTQKVATPHPLQFIDGLAEKTWFRHFCNTPSSRGVSRRRSVHACTGGWSCMMDVSLLCVYKQIWSNWRFLIHVKLDAEDISYIR